MTKKPWYLSRRIILAFGLTTALLTLTMSALGAHSVTRAIQEEIENLTREELEETRAWYSRTKPTGGDLEDISKVLRDHHPKNYIAWKIWTKDGQPPREFGDV